MLAKGSMSWLIASELMYGGYHNDVPRRKVSIHDLRTADELRQGGMIGGDRMSPFRNGYGRFYAKYLNDFVVAKSPVVFTEVGILKGTGLAIWSDLFPNGSIIGLDIDLSYTKNNLPLLEAKGAFANKNVELHEFDQYSCSPESVDSFLKGRKIDVCIDDGVHSDKAILNTFKAIYPHLSDRFVYFVEDNYTVHEKFGELRDVSVVESVGMFTVLRQRK